MSETAKSKLPPVLMTEDEALAIATAAADEIGRMYPGDGLLLHRVTIAYRSAWVRAALPKWGKAFVAAVDGIGAQDDKAVGG